VKNIFAESPTEDMLSPKKRELEREIWRNTDTTGQGTHKERVRERDMEKH
jgi:hypothetical protein